MNHRTTASTRLTRQAGSLVKQTLCRHFMKQRPAPGRAMPSAIAWEKNLLFEVIVGNRVVLLSDGLQC